MRPNDPIKKKTEEKDKYWLRAFRTYMQAAYPILEGCFTPQELEFWRDHLSRSGKPDKKNRYLSYGRSYKDFLFSHSTFVYYFQKWFFEAGGAELSNKCAIGSDLWFVFYDYASKELYHYRPFTKQENSQPSSFAEEFALKCKPSDEFIDLVLNAI